MGALSTRQWLPKNHSFDKVQWRTAGNVEVKLKSHPGRADGERLPEEWRTDAARVQVVRRGPNRRTMGFNVEMARTVRVTGRQDGREWSQSSSMSMRIHMDQKKDALEPPCPAMRHQEAIHHGWENG